MCDEVECICQYAVTHNCFVPLCIWTVGWVVYPRGSSNWQLSDKIMTLGIVLRGRPELLHPDVTLFSVHVFARFKVTSCVV